jgi:hypothetical protein
MRRERCAVLIALAALAATVSRKSAAQRVEVQTWQPPRTGWLYVIDATSGESRIFLFAPELGEVRGTIHTGHNPDVALSPRGDRLYLASDFYGCGQPNCDRLAVIDTQAGRVLSTTPIPDRVHYKIYPTSSRMAVSADGRTVYLMKWTGLPSGDTPVALAAFDTVRERFLDGAIDLGACGSGGFVPVPNQNQLGFHCGASNEVAITGLTHRTGRRSNSRCRSRGESGCLRGTCTRTCRPARSSFRPTAGDCSSRAATVPSRR